MVKALNLKTGSRPAWIWDIDAPVGLGRTNRPADVVLVQLLLNGSLRSVGLRDERKPFNAREDNPVMGVAHGYPGLDFLKVDGICGPNTRYAIASYQKKQGVGEGGVVTPMVGIDDAPLVMIYSLNYQLWQDTHRLFPEERFPPIVTADLKRP